MTVRARPKPKAHAETARVLRIYEWLTDEIGKQGFPLTVWDDARGVYVADSPLRAAALAVAERIAARTED